MGASPFPPPLFPFTPQVPPDYGRKVWIQWISHFPPFHPHSFPSNQPTPSHFLFPQWSQFCCVHPQTCCFRYGYLPFLIFAISYFYSTADLAPQVLLLPFYPWIPKRSLVFPSRCQTNLTTPHNTTCGFIGFSHCF